MADSDETTPGEDRPVEDVAENVAASDDAAAPADAAVVADQGTEETRGTTDVTDAEESSARSGEADETPEDLPEESPAPEPAELYGVPLSYSRGQTVLHPSRDQYVDLVKTLRDEGYWMCVDVCGVDYLTADLQRTLPDGVEPERFEIVVGLLNLTERARLRLRVQIPAGDPTVASITQFHPGARNPEREIFDMFGIRFDNHPDPSRILMPDDWEGYPLRKDYSVGSIPVQFKEASTTR